MSPHQKLAIVTGANKGIGFQVARNLCRTKEFDGQVILTSRDEARGRAAVEILQKEGLCPIYHQLDITDEESCERCAEYVKAEYGGVDILVNNAGFAFKKKATEAFSVQAEETLKVNYFGLLRVCKYFEPLLRPHARVVNVASGSGLLRHLRSDDLKEQLTSETLTQDKLDRLVQEWRQAVAYGTHVSTGWPASAYGTTKLLVIAFTKVQQRRFTSDPREDIVANAVHPGLVQTDMSSHQGNLTPEEGARAVVFAALLPPNSQTPKGQLIWHDSTVVDWRS